MVFIDNIFKYRGLSLPYLLMKMFLHNTFLYQKCLANGVSTRGMKNLDSGGFVGRKYNEMKEMVIHLKSDKHFRDDAWIIELSFMSHLLE